MKKLADKIREHLANILVTIAGLLVFVQLAAGVKRCFVAKAAAIGSL